nr:MAG TPA: hypothetical protein [Bacteriophage sp.]
MKLFLYIRNNFQKSFLRKEVELKTQFNEFQNNFLEIFKIDYLK